MILIIGACVFSIVIVLSILIICGLPLGEMELVNYIKNGQLINEFEFVVEE